MLALLPRPWSRPLDCHLLSAGRASDVPCLPYKGHAASKQLEKNQSAVACVRYSFHERPFHSGVALAERSLITYCGVLATVGKKHCSHIHALS